MFPCKLVMFSHCTLGSRYWMYYKKPNFLQAVKLINNNQMSNLTPSGTQKVFQVLAHPKADYFFKLLNYDFLNLIIKTLESRECVNLDSHILLICESIAINLHHCYLLINKVLAVLLDFVSLHFFFFFQFEGGLHPTSLVVYATYTFSEYSGKAPAITEV